MVTSHVGGISRVLPLKLIDEKTCLGEISSGFELVSVLFTQMIYGLEISEVIATQKSPSENKTSPVYSY